MARRCKQCKAVELLPASRCTDYLEKQGFCSIDCSAIYSLAKVRKAKDKKARAELKARKEGIKTNRDLKKEAQTVVNAYIRLRDSGKPCISCGRTDYKADAGHYRSAGNNSQLCFNTLNIHAQCARPCNRDLSGNLIEYRKGLIKKIGLERVEQLENDYSEARYSAEYLRRIKAVFKKKIKLYEKLRA